MGVACSMDIRPGTMDRAMDHEARCVHSGFIAADDLAVRIDLDHVAGLQHAKVFPHPGISQIVLA